MIKKKSVILIFRQKNAKLKNIYFYKTLEIPEIPDLEEPEEPAEDMAFKVAEAPE